MNEGPFLFLQVPDFSSRALQLVSFLCRCHQGDRVVFAAQQTGRHLGRQEREAPDCTHLVIVVHSLLRLLTGLLKCICHCTRQLTPCDV